MGGSGSGRTGARAVVESGLFLSAYYLQREGYLRFPVLGSIGWKTDGREFANMSIETLWNSASEEVDRIRLRSRINGEPTEQTLCISWQQRKTGPRAFVHCPRCGRRYSKLYLPPGARYFACRRCYNLTYQSSNESRGIGSLIRRAERGSDVAALLLAEELDKRMGLR